jgi:hypothetical protein
MTSFETDWRPYIRIDLEPPATEDELDRLLSKIVDVTDDFGKEVSYDLAVSGGAIHDSLAHRPMGSGNRDALIRHITDVVERAAGEWKNSIAPGMPRSAYIATAVMDHLWKEHPLGH